MTWYLYVVRTATGSLYAGVATDVARRFREHAAGGARSARFLKANPPRELAFARRIGPRSLALKVEYRFKRLPKCAKEAIVRTGRLSFDRASGRIRPAPPGGARHTAGRATGMRERRAVATAVRATPGGI